jgi:transcriptional regulator ATRX
LEPDDEVREIPILPKDRLFAEMLQKYEDTIWKYHEHDTLLENKEEETLDEDERKQAWEEFEQEKTRPQLQQYYPQPQMRNTGPVTSNNIFGIRTDILLKLLSMKARLDNPTITETNVKHAIPLLMQELYRQMDRGELTVSIQLLCEYSVAITYIFLSSTALSTITGIVKLLGSSPKLRRKVPSQ